MRRVVVTLPVVSVLSLLSVALSLPAAADHTNSREKQATTAGPSQVEGVYRGAGTFTFLRNFPPNPGSDLEPFTKARRLWASTGTLGQGEEQHVGQRIIRLVNKEGKVKPRWVADHGSANCRTANPAGTTGLQHDVQVTPRSNPKLLIDTTDATGRCHDPGGGGLEIVDISRLHKKGFKPQEIHLTRHEGFSHTVTVDATRPWIVYNNSSQSTGANWIDALNIKSCLGPGSVKEKRNACRPKVYRIHFQPEWTQRIDGEGNRVEGTEATCHDITATPGRIYCGGLNATLIIDVTNLTAASGAIRGNPLPCEVTDGTNTTAKVTDCSQPIEGSPPQATGWKFLGTVNHPGRNQGSTNTQYTSREGIAVSHEAEPTPDHQWMFVTDERGGGVVPGGASCANEVENPYGNGGVHVFDISNPGKIDYALTPQDEKAVFIGEVVVPSTTFCTAHVMEQIPGEQRFTIGWYTQGTKIVDYFIDDNGRWTFRETASVVWPGANTWASEVFKIVSNDDGTRTYYFLATDIDRGIDIFSWTGPPNPAGTPPPRQVMR